MRGIRVVEGTSSSARGACVGIFNITTMRMAIVPILILLVGVGGTCRPTATALLASVQGWLLPVASAIASVATASSASMVVSAVVVMTLLLLGGIVDIAGWWLLLSDDHAELLEPCQLRLDGGYAVGLALDPLLCGCVRGAKVPKGLAVQCDGATVIVHGRHAIAMLQGWDACLNDEGDGVGPEPLEGVERLIDAGICKLPCILDANPCSLAYIPQHLIMRRPMSMMLCSSIRYLAALTYKAPRKSRVTSCSKPLVGCQSAAICC
jgi:hypothetical protein